MPELEGYAWDCFFLKASAMITAASMMVMPIESLRMSVVSPKMVRETMTARGILILFMTARAPAWVVMAPTFQRKKPMPVAMVPRKTRVQA